MPWFTICYLVRLTINNRPFHNQRFNCLGWYFGILTVWDEPYSQLQTTEFMFTSGSGRWEKGRWICWGLRISTSVWSSCMPTCYPANASPTGDNNNNKGAGESKTEIMPLYIMMILSSPTTMILVVMDWYHFQQWNPSLKLKLRKMERNSYLCLCQILRVKVGPH